ncbi:MAG: 4'-phosphopantetheinyl transferase superfamily protein [Anaerolineae bacterium]|nr:4'-phosphopantetheinyl transferase superfamily protein [Anaerolineae bacterium]
MALHAGAKSVKDEDRATAVMRPAQTQGAQAQLELAPDHLHLWRAEANVFRDVCAGSEAYSGMLLLLSEDERERAERFRFSEPRERFVIGRGILRCILSRYVGVAPQELVFEVGSMGKPALAGPASGLLHFNVAHTEDLLLILVGRGLRRRGLDTRGGGSVGVDVERVRPLAGMARMTAMLFEPEHRPQIESLTQDARIRAILTAWTLTEALGKAAGDGLADAVRWARLQVDPATGLPLTIQRCCDGKQCYWACSIALGTDHGDGHHRYGGRHHRYIGAVAVEGPVEGNGPAWHLQSGGRHHRYEITASDLLSAVSDSAHG